MSKSTIKGGNCWDPNKRQLEDGESFDPKKNKQCNDSISVDQLPDIDSCKITLYFDTDFVKRTMYLCHNGKDIWEGKLPCPNDTNGCTYQNFTNVLKEKYGWRLYDVVPTDRSLYFDQNGKIQKVSELECIKKFRNDLKNQSFHYIDAKEFARRISWLSKYYHNKYRLRFPLLSWEYIPENKPEDIVKNLDEGVTHEFYEGPYYDSYAEGDFDHCLVTNLHLPKEQQITLSTFIWNPFWHDEFELYARVDHDEQIRGVYFPFCWDDMYKVDDDYLTKDFKNVMDNLFPGHGKIKIIQKREKVIKIRNTVMELS